MDKPHILYAMPHSLYSGRARSYLIKNRIPFEERSTGHESFKAEVLPNKAITTAVEAGVTLPWYKFADKVLGVDSFGESAPAQFVRPASSSVSSKET